MPNPHEHDTPAPSETKTAELDRIAQRLAEQKAAGTARTFDDVQAMRDAAAKDRR
jgi:hypothetical protein